MFDYSEDCYFPGYTVDVHDHSTHGLCISPGFLPPRTPIVVGMPGISVRV